MILTMIREQFLRTIQKFRMIERGDTVFVGVSGGPDSVTLLHLLNGLKKPWKLNLGILHVNHQLRGKDSDHDERFVRRLGRRFKIPAYVTHADVRRKAKDGKISLEESAREARYQFFEKAAKLKKADKIAVAHNQDDQAETVLMRIITGTGLQGLQAIRPKRKLNGSFIIRPLIEIPRNEIRNFVKMNRIQFREDRSNRLSKFLRNRIRMKLIPFIERTFNPQVKKVLARLPYLLDVDLSFLEENAENFYQKFADKKRASEISFPKQQFLDLNPSIQYRVLNRAMREIAKSELDFDHWNTFMEFLSRKDKFVLQFPKGLFASVARDAVRIYKIRKVPPPFFYELSPGESIYISEIDSTVSCESLAERIRAVRKTDKNFDVFDADKLSFPLMVRNRKPGDRFQPLGQKTSFKLKSFLINKRIPLEERDCLPIVCSNGEIIWVGKTAMNDKFKVTPHTKRFVKISAF